MPDALRPPGVVETSPITFVDRAKSRAVLKGHERADSVKRRVDSVIQFAYGVLGADEIAKEAGRTLLGKAENVRDAAVGKAREIRDIAVAKKDAAIASYRAKEAEMQMKAREQRDRIVGKAKELGHKGAEAVASGINTVVGVAETGVGIAVGGAVMGAYAVERGMMTTLAEVQAVPRELKAQAQEGLASLAFSVADRAQNFGDRRRVQAQFHRTVATAVRMRFAQPGPVGRMMGR